MKNNKLLLAAILIISLASAGCSVQSNQQKTSTNQDVKVGEAKSDSSTQAQKDQEALLKERELLEAKRKIQIGEFYVPLPKLGQEPKLKTVKAKAIYLTGNVAGFNFDEKDVNYYAEYIRSISGESGKPADTSRMEEINKLEKALAICKATEVNALVIDIKNDDGLIVWNSDIELVEKLNSNRVTPFKKYDKLMSYLSQNDIYSIARVVAFKDPYFAKIKPEHAIQLKTGGVYKDKAGISWVNPFDEYIWKYALAISKESALRGFNEVQFDYVRFPDNAKTYNPITEFPGRNDRAKDDVIEQFLTYAHKELEPYKVNVSADVFGFITRSWDDQPEDIGQTWRKIAKPTDYICPMIYPSHYGPGLYGYDVPDKHPYEISRLALMEAIERNAAQKKPAIIRPWFQGFTASWVKGNIDYDAKAISDQIVASMELGIDEYIIWNATCNYEPMSFFYHERMNKNIRKSEEDILSRTPEIMLTEYLRAEKKGRYSALYLLTPIAERQEDYESFVLEIKKTLPVLKNYEIISITKNTDKEYLATVNVDYSSTKGTVAMKEAKFKIVLENNVFKVIKPELVWTVKSK